MKEPLHEPNLKRFANNEATFFGMIQEKRKTHNSLSWKSRKSLSHMPSPNSLPLQITCGGSQAWSISFVFQDFGRRYWWTKGAGLRTLSCRRTWVQKLLPYNCWKLLKVPAPAPLLPYRILIDRMRVSIFTILDILMKWW